MLDIMKAVDEQLQTVIDGTMEDNKKEADSETRRYGEGFCAGIELAQRYIRNTALDDLISKDEILKLIESFKVVSNQKLSKEDFERNDVLRMLEEVIKGVTLEEACT